MGAFLPGLELCRGFFEDVVRPLLVQYVPDLPYTAALIGPGSDVLGFDTAMSMDHDWGPRLLLFLREQDISLVPSIDMILRQHLPHVYADLPISIEGSDEAGITAMHLTTTGPVNHHIALLTLRSFLQFRLAYNLDQPLEVADWLTFPSQELRAITAGAVYHDDIGELTTLRTRLAWYPHDIWLYLLAAGWQRIGQEEHLMPRAGFVGDEPGSALLGSRLVRDMMNVCFLMEKQYAPYPKWFGTAFKQLRCAHSMYPLLWQAQLASTWQAREKSFCEAYALLARMHNMLGITEKLPETVSSFHERPFQVIHGEEFARALLAQIKNAEVQKLTGRPLIGSIDQISDSTDLHAPSWRSSLRKLYE